MLREFYLLFSTYYINKSNMVTYIRKNICKWTSRPLLVEFRFCYRPVLQRRGQINWQQTSGREKL